MLFIILFISGGARVGMHEQDNGQQDEVGLCEGRV